jgi:very-short-patch-repair endonuclease
MSETFLKITEELYEDTDDIATYLVKSVKTAIKNEVIAHEIFLQDSLINCESPIEQLLSIALASVQSSIDIPLLVDVIAIDNQQEIVCNGNTYRADFLVAVKYWNGGKFFVIECDGHEFHQKTKEQVERDNQRTRDMQLAGYEVIRFSGTEIYHRAHKCALEVKRIIQAPAIKWLERAAENV